MAFYIEFHHFQHNDPSTRLARLIFRDAPLIFISHVRAWLEDQGMSKRGWTQAYVIDTSQQRVVAVVTHDPQTRRIALVASAPDTGKELGLEGPLDTAISTGIWKKDAANADEALIWARGELVQGTVVAALLEKNTIRYAFDITNHSLRMAAWNM